MSMKKTDVVTELYDFVRSPTGRRLVGEVKRHIADPRHRRRQIERVRSLRRDRPEYIVVDADPPAR